MRIQTEDAEHQARWIEKPLDQCALIQTGVSKGRKMSPETLISVPYLRVANVQDGYLDLSEIKEIHVRPQDVPRYALQSGDVLLTEGGDFDKLGRGFVWNGELPECIHQNHVFAVRVDQSQLDPHFFAYQAQSPHGKQYFLSVAHKTTNLACINTTKLKAFPVRIPPLPEQKEIVHILSTVQRAIKAQEQIIKTTTELKRALMQKLFSEGLRGEPQKETEIGLVPDSWDLAPIGELFDTQLGKMLSQKAKVGDRPKRYLRNKNVQWGRIDSDDLLSMDFNDIEVKKFLLKEGDLLICEGGEVGRAAIWQGQITECYYQKALHRLRPRSAKITNEFMAYWMMFAFLLSNTYGITGTRTTIAHLPEIKLKPLLVPIPSLCERDEIVSTLDSINLKLENNRRRHSQLQDIYSTLLHALMNTNIRMNNAAIQQSACTIQ
jgi:type I restriction enzyme S subunit